jgi:hypothetical protein
MWGPAESAIGLVTRPLLSLDSPICTCDISRVRKKLTATPPKPAPYTRYKVSCGCIIYSSRAGLDYVHFARAHAARTHNHGTGETESAREKSERGRERALIKKGGEGTHNAATNAPGDPSEKLLGGKPLLSKPCSGMSSRGAL